MEAVNSNPLQTGSLYLCATPIGNLDDMTFRAIKTLKEAAIIAAEDTRHTRKLLSYFDIHTPLISYHEHNKQQQGPILIDKLLAGDSIAVVSDAGLPGVSDPGADLAALAIENGIRVIPIPGANAALSGLIASGLDTTLFMFAGFLSKTKKKREERLFELATVPYTLIFYESPYRIKDTLNEILTILGNRKMAAARELTKYHEEFLRGRIQDIIKHFEAVTPKGEFTLVVEGYVKQDSEEQILSDTDIYQAVKDLMINNIDKKTAMKLVAEKFNLSKRDVYKVLLEKNM